MTCIFYTRTVDDKWRGKVPDWLKWKGITAGAVQHNSIAPLKIAHRKRTHSIDV